MNKEEKEKTYELFENLKSDTISIEKVKQAEKKIGFLGNVAGDFKILLLLLKEYWNGNFKIEIKELAIIIGAISYVAMPLDIILDILPIIGFTDDIVIVGLAVKQLKTLIERFKKEKGIV